MNVNDHVVPSGQHYSGRNRVPNIQQFMDQLDLQKKERDAEIDAHLKKNGKNKEVADHTNSEMPKSKDTRTVRDPVTGKDVQIRDAKMDFKEAVDNPQVRRELAAGGVCFDFDLTSCSCPSQTKTWASQPQ
jgi:hypothetical protein